MKVISTETSYILHSSLGLADNLDLPLNIEVEVSETDAKVLLTLPGVKKASTELLNVKEAAKSPQIQNQPLSIKE